MLEFYPVFHNNSILTTSQIANFLLSGKSIVGQHLGLAEIFAPMGSQKLTSQKFSVVPKLKVFGFGEISTSVNPESPSGAIISANPG